MYRALSPSAVNLGQADLAANLERARRHGFAGLEVNIREVADQIDAHGIEAVRERFARAGVRPAGWFLPVGIAGADDAWRRDIAALPRLAAAGAAIGCTRAVTYIWPCSNERPMAENRAFHRARLAPAAGILADHGCRLGLEFLGPKTIRDQMRHPFIHTMDGMLELCRELGPHVGLLLDSWHWYTSHGTLAALRALRPEQVVYVHLNDAPRGIAIDQQIDLVRKLPGETGVIDLAGFLGALRAIGYDGPVVVEPFAKELAALADDEARLVAVRRALDSVWGHAQIAAGGA